MLAFVSVSAADFATASIKAKKKKPKPQNVMWQFQMIHTCNGFHAEHQTLSVPCHAKEYTIIL